jgi:hypothetical protein
MISHENLNITICDKSEAVQLVMTSNKLYYDVIFFIHDPNIYEDNNDICNFFTGYCNNVVELDFYDTNTICVEEEKNIILHIDLLKENKIAINNILFCCDKGFGRSQMTAIIFMKYIGISKNECGKVIKKIQKTNNMKNVILFLEKTFK